MYVLFSVLDGNSLDYQQWLKLPRYIISNNIDQSVTTQENKLVNQVKNCSALSFMYQYFLFVDILHPIGDLPNSRET